MKVRSSSDYLHLTAALRLYPSVPFNVRTALVDTTLPRGGGPDGMDVFPYNLGVY
jgi:hypothetical protein